MAYFGIVNVRSSGQFVREFVILFYLIVVFSVHLDKYKTIFANKCTVY